MFTATAGSKGGRRRRKIGLRSRRRMQQTAFAAVANAADVA
jgi:hypothetical protein